MNKVCLYVFLFITWNMSSINLANIDPTLCGLNGVCSLFGSSGTGRELTPVVIPVIWTDDDGEAGETGDAAGWLSAATCTFFSSETELTATSLTVAWKLQYWIIHFLYIHSYKLSYYQKWRDIVQVQFVE